MHRHRSLIAIIGATGLLAACGAADESGAEPVEPVAESETSEETTPAAFVDALGEIGKDWVIADYVHFVDQSRINELEKSDEGWKELGANRSAQTLSYLAQPEALLGLDFASAEFVISAGGLWDGDFNGVSLISGGQDTAWVEEMAMTSGWVGQSPLFRYEGNQPNVPQGMQVLLVDDDSVATANPETDMDVVGGLDPTLAEQEHIGDLAQCLGDPVSADIYYRVRPDATDEYAVGVVAGEDGEPRSVVCSWFRNAYIAEQVGDKAVEDVRNADIRGTTEFSGRKYNELFDSPTVSVVGTMLRTELSHKDDTPIDAIITLGNGWTALGIS